MIKKRGSGILLHITSLPSPHGIGDLGPWAYRFVDFLRDAKQSFWQVLPLNITDPAHGNSPYHSISALASNPLMISPDLMVQEGYLAEGDLEPEFRGREGLVDYHAAIAYKNRVFQIAFEKFMRKERNHGYEIFCSENAFWLDDFAFFVALKEHYGGRAWSDWPQEIRDREPEALQILRTKLSNRIQMEKFLQHLFHHQWGSLKGYCNQQGIEIFGDIPIYVNHDSVDLWTNSEIFKLDSQKRPDAVSGVPPDYFSETGQLWGNPVYRWDVLKETDYAWWIQRIEYNLKLFDLVRIDHFRGFVSYWEVPAGEKNAVNGKWVEAPAEDFFNTLLQRFPNPPIIAEDLGIITPDVREVMNDFQFPGMRLLLFAFGEDLPTNLYAPHNHIENCVVYTGTHDNNTVRGWYEGEATPEDKERLLCYLDRDVTTQNVHREFIRLAMMSVAKLVILPMQDILGLGGDARMNLPATTGGNWQWRLLPEHLEDSRAERLTEMTKIFGRA
jgi:4-alpha-glucanotransferase